MTLEELKVEAKKHGYKLTKEYPYIRLVPCICGCNRRTMWFGFDNTYVYRCNKCGFEGEKAKTKNEAKLKWNECVENAGREVTK
jgi:hypothetical protein